MSNNFCYHLAGFSFPDHTKVQYFIEVPDVKYFDKKDLERLRQTIGILLFARYDDVIVCGIEKGSVIVSFMIRNYLIPCLRALYKSEVKGFFQKMFKQEIFKVMIQDDVVYMQGIFS